MEGVVPKRYTICGLDEYISRVLFWNAIFFSYSCSSTRAGYFQVDHKTGFRSAVDKRKEKKHKTVFKQGIAKTSWKRSHVGDLVRAWRLLHRVCGFDFQRGPVWKRFRRASPKGSRERARRGEGTMDSEQGPPASSSSTTASTASSTSTSNITASSSTGRQAVPQISVYGGIPDRQTVQVFQQAMHRPNTAAQYLQQMYAAQQQHLMLQTAALQQQHLSTAQLQSLAAVQQASIAAGRQNSTQNSTLSQQTGSPQTTVSAINLTTSPAAAQLISRAQGVSSAPAGSVSQQAVILGSPSSPTTLTASQAHMYLRAQMAQQSNLVQVARSLGRAVPLSPQLIFTPTAAVTAVQSESSTQTPGQQSASAQVQNLAIRSQQGATTSSSQTHSLQALSLKQSPVSIQPSPLVKKPKSGQPELWGEGQPA
ncbi:hypothetical protein UPYG_G00171620 [Umbra pygmaea]|uniref:Polyhomeotic-like protein 2 n=1 Tax=Umbra pygmaea TaxID=75934 RepID=A0ABD0WNT6_UMBPY